MGLPSKQMVALLAALMGALLTVVVSLDLWREYRNAVRLAESTTRNLVRVLEEHARQTLRRVELSLLAASGDVRQARTEKGISPAQLQARFTALLPPDGLIRGMGVADRDGNVQLWASRPLLAQPATVATSDHFTAHRDSAAAALVFGAPLAAREHGGGRLIPVSVRLVSGGGAFEGIVFALLAPGYFQDLYDFVETGSNGSAALYLRSGWLVVRSPYDERVLAQRWDAAPLFRSLLQDSGAGTVRQASAADGIRRVYSYRALADYPVVAVTGVSLTDSLAAWRARAWRDLALLLATLGGIAAAAFLLNRQLAKREAAEAQLALALEGSGNALWDYDLRRGEVVLNARWAEMLGAPGRATRTSAKGLMGLVHPEDLPRVEAALREALQGGQGEYSVEHRVRTAAGGWLWILSRGKVSARDARGRGLRITGINADISERKLAAERLEQLAFYDPLTGAANRAMLVDRLDRAAARSRRSRTLLALLYMDIDRFKSINDGFGHAAGDALLKAFAARLKACVRETDTVARLGGDEFVVLLEDVKELGVVERIAGKILQAAAQPVAADGREIAITTSIGVALHDRDEDLEALQKRADAALYEAKAAGRNAFRVAR